MREVDDILANIVKLIQKDHFDKAAELMFSIVEDQVLGILNYQYGWERDEAESIFHDAYLLIQQKIIDDELQEISKTYIIKTCKFIGANQYRKTLRSHDKFNDYALEFRHQMKQEMNEYIGLDLYDDFTETFNDGSIYKKALRAFSVLNEQCQEIIRLKFVQELKHEEIINQIESISTSRSSITILNRCVKKWKGYIDQIKIST